MAKQLSARRVQTAKDPGLYADGDGLYLRVTPSGTRGWIFRFQLGGRRRDMGLGRVEDVSLAEARVLAAAARKLARDGIDPIEDRAANRRDAQAPAPEESVRTLRMAAESYLAGRAHGWKSLKHERQWSATLETYVFPTLGDAAVEQIDVDDVLAVLEPIWTTKTETANRVRGRLEAILDYAKARRWRDGENPARWRGHLDQILAPRSAVRPVRHQPALPYAEMPAFWARLSVTDGLGARALQFQILTAARPGNALDARWDDIDLDAAIWTIPGESMKGRLGKSREHRVPLSAPALALLRGMSHLRVTGSPSAVFVFPGQRRGRPLSNMAMLKVTRSLELQAVPHGFRSTFRTWAGEVAGAPHEICEAALAHTQGDKVVEAYQRGDFFARRRELMDAWAGYVTGTTRGAGSPSRPVPPSGANETSVRHLEARPERGHRGVMQRPMMLGPGHVSALRQGQRQVATPSRRVVAFSLAEERRVIQDGFNAATQARRRLRLLHPYRPQDGQDIGCGNGVDGPRSDRGERIGPQCRFPLGGVLLVPPARRLGRDVEQGDLLEGPP